MTTEWGFTETFRHADPERVRRLERAMSLDDVVIAMLRVPPRVDGIRLKPHRGCGDLRQRVEFCLRVNPCLLDAFFNGPRGYRAEFLRVGLEAANEIDRRIVKRIADAYREQLASEPLALRSLNGAQAKVWIRQGQMYDEALRGQTRRAPDIDVARWIARMDEPIDSGPRGVRWLARAGVIAPPLSGVLDVKGGWLEGSEFVCVDDPGKAGRSQQILDFGFT